MILSKKMVIIPARGGSKGVKNKNLKLLNGIPLVEHTIKQAIEDLVPDFINLCDIVLSSDSVDILDVGSKYGITCRKRADDISGDYASTEDAMLEAIRYSPEAETIVLLQPTSPIRFPGRIRECVEEFIAKEYDSLLTTQKLYDFFWRVDLSGSYYPSYQLKNRPMRQELTPQQYGYFDNGNIYITKRDILVREKSRIGGKVGVKVISDFESMQIDTEDDFLIFESIFNNSFQKLTVGDINESSNSSGGNR